MPKKFKENTKAAEAKARKNAVKEEQEHRKQQALEDELWKEDDKHVLKKIQRKVWLNTTELKWCFGNINACY